MDDSLKEEVRARAGNVCEYCHLPEAYHPVPFEIEHVIPRQHGGKTATSNLAYSCLHCNRHKGPNISGLERRGTSPKLVALFNPRKHRWRRHFAWAGARLLGLSAIGRVTIEVLAINNPVRVALRQELLDEGIRLEN